MTTWLLWLVLGAPVIAIIVKLTVRPPRRPKLLTTPYTRPGPWHFVKRITARIFLIRRRRRLPRLIDTYDVKSNSYSKLGVAPSEREEAMESPRALTHREAEDGMFIYGTDKAGNSLDLKLHRKIGRLAEVFFVFKLSDGTTYQLPGAPDTLITNTDGKSFTAGGIKLLVIEPMRKWRVLFNGLVRKSKGQDEEIVHLRMNFIWTAFSRPYEFKREFSRGLLAEAMARELWRNRMDWKLMCESPWDGFDQWGTLYGFYQEGEDVKEHIVHLRGLRQRRWGKSNPATLHRTLTLVVNAPDGTSVCINAISDSSKLTHEVWGHVFHPIGHITRVTSCDLDLKDIGESGTLPRHFTIRLAARFTSYHLIIHLTGNEVETFSGRPWDRRTQHFYCQATLNAQQCRAVLLLNNRFSGHCTLGNVQSAPFLGEPDREPAIDERKLLVLPFESEGCRFSSLVGGKGSSLALLTSLQGKYDSPQFVVPTGFSVTLTAWKKQIGSSLEIAAALRRVEDVARGRVEGSLEEACTKATELILETAMDTDIRLAVEGALKGFDIEKSRFAVRSSAFGEDGEALSSAGQNATILGCTGTDSILRAIVQCWSSLLSFNSVEYRRRHGQELVPGMSVVVQEIVDANVAGVLFTVDPSTGNPGKMVITANHGLGESVVSGSSEPDTIILKRTYSNMLSVLQKTVGAKNTKTVLTESGTTEVEVSREDASALCLDDSLCLQLGKLGVRLEQAFGSPRDIEFAIAQGKIYLLQARPITALGNWTDFELSHEQDSPVICDKEYLTKANTGEVIPGASSPLTLSTLCRLLDLGIQRSLTEKIGRPWEVCPWVIKQTGFSQYHVFLNVINTMLNSTEEKLNIANYAVDMAVFGHIATDEKLHALGVARFGVIGAAKKFWRYYYILHDFLFNRKRTKKAAARFEHFNIPAENFHEAEDLYHCICRKLPEMLNMSYVHTQTSEVATTAQLIGFILLLDGQAELTSELLSEVSVLFSSCADVESAEVPVAMRKLADVIKASEECKEFLEMSADVAAVWLQTHPGNPGVQYRDFIKRHGHRCIREFDFAVKPWGLDPRSLVSILQTMIRVPDQHSKKKAEDEWKTVLNRFKPSIQRALRWIIPMSRTAVGCREQTKSLLIRTVHAFRLAYQRLGNLLVYEGKLPEADLIYYLSHYEVGLLIRTRDPQLISKAFRRRKMQQSWDSLQFPEICIGLPQPDNETSDVDVTSNTVSLKGTPVYRGKVKGVGRVVLTLEEAKSIQPGDILITRATDIGWSPYFPLLSGVVTELGGLISHGAVVAREYGLPCIVGAQKATQLFRSGDLVVLDGSTGILSKVDSDS